MKLRHEAKEKGHEFIESGPGNPEVGEVHVGGALEVIGSPEGLRVTSKIAYVGLALRGGVKLTTSNAFGEIREFMRGGTGKPTSRLFVHERFLDRVQLGPHQHALIVAARHDKGRVDAIIRLFGGLCYFVVLSDHYGGADFSYTLACDAHRGEVSAVLQSHVDAEMLQTEDVLMSADTVWDDLPASAERFVKFIGDAIRAKQERETR